MVHLWMTVFWTGPTGECTLGVYRFGARSVKGCVCLGGAETGIVVRVSDGVCCQRNTTLWITSTDGSWNITVLCFARIQAWTHWMKFPLSFLSDTLRSKKYVTFGQAYTSQCHPLLLREVRFHQVRVDLNAWHSWSPVLVRCNHDCQATVLFRTQHSLIIVALGCQESENCGRGHRTNFEQVIATNLGGISSVC